MTMKSYDNSIGHYFVIGDWGDGTNWSPSYDARDSHGMDAK